MPKMYRNWKKKTLLGYTPTHTTEGSKWHPKAPWGVQRQSIVPSNMMATQQVESTCVLCDFLLFFAVATVILIPIIHQIIPFPLRTKSYDDHFNIKMHPVSAGTGLDGTLQYQNI